MKDLHDRMPVIVPKDKHARWLDPAIKQAAQLTDMLNTPLNDALALYPVTTSVGNPRFEDPSFVEPIGQTDLFG